MGNEYRNLASHLDNLPAGFPATDSGVELRILRRLFTQQEAEVAVGLSMMPEAVDKIAKRLDMDESVLAPILESMSKKGLIGRYGKGDQKGYMAAQFIVGIWEYHVKSLDEGLIKDFNEYAPYFLKEAAKNKTQQLRVIPVSKSISAEMNIMPYEQVEEIIKSQSKIIVAPCICRTEHAMVGKGCDKPVENCLVFGTGAYYYEENGLGRPISQDEALKILDEGLEAGLVLQPGNSKKPLNICMCCGCCCQILKNIKTMDKPARIVCTSYYAAVNEEECVACGTCEERCPMDAITVDDVACVNTERCIGCGVCVAGCEVGAIGLREKEETDKWIPPANVVETYMNIARERGKL
jgi:ferredoxin